jgi:hypothetical protein
MTSRDPLSNQSLSLSGYRLSKTQQLHQIGSVDPVSLLTIATLDEPAEEGGTGAGEDEGFGKEPDLDLDERHGFADPLEQEMRQFSARHSGQRGWCRSSSQRSREQTIGLFGSLLTTSTPYYVNGPASLSSALNAAYHKDKHLSQPLRSSKSLLDGEESADSDVTASFLTALAPMRDRYLTAALNKMNEPVLQVEPSSPALPWPHLPG